MADEARPKPILDVLDISAITYGFMASKALFAALEFNLFTHIAQGAASTSALAKATGIAENRLVTLLAALKSLGLISEADGRLINAPATTRYLVTGAPGDFRDYVQLVNGEFGYESFRHLGAALRGERVFPEKGTYEGLVYEARIGGERFSSAQHTGSLGPARMLAKRLNLKDRHKLLDVGGGSSAYSIAFCAANPGLRATILDFPETVETARRYAREAGLSDRIAHVGGNAIKVDWPADTTSCSCPMSGARSGRPISPSWPSAQSRRCRRAGSRSSTISWSTTRMKVRLLLPGISWAPSWTIQPPSASPPPMSSASCETPFQD